jgi:sigma-B regulation protein RsbU (phosphoserine phosphatase)
LVRASGSFELLQGGGPVLGIVASAKYENYRVDLQRGDMLVIYSDGVTEASCPGGEEFGEERLGATLAVRVNEPAQSIIEAVNRAIAEWTGGTPAADDITLIVARRN